MRARKQKPLRPGRGRGRAPSVRFEAAPETRPFDFDWGLAGEYFYSRRELDAMRQERFDDARALRGGSPGPEEAGATADGPADVADLVDRALGWEDRDGDATIRGIEHFVYPQLAQEMIRRKKEVQREVLGFVRSRRPDPQGWRLAQHSRAFTEWARDVAAQKAIRHRADVDELDSSGSGSSKSGRRSRSRISSREAGSSSTYGGVSSGGSSSGSRSGSGSRISEIEVELDYGAKAGEINAKINVFEALTNLTDLTDSSSSASSSIEIIDLLDYGATADEINAKLNVFEAPTDPASVEAPADGSSSYEMKYESDYGAITEELNDEIRYESDYGVIADELHAGIHCGAKADEINARLNVFETLTSPTSTRSSVSPGYEIEYESDCGERANGMSARINCGAKADEINARIDVFEAPTDLTSSDGSGSSGETKDGSNRDEKADELNARINVFEALTDLTKKWDFAFVREQMESLREMADERLGKRDSKPAEGRGWDYPFI